MRIDACGKTFYSRHMKAEDAAAVCRWRYGGPMEAYNTEDTPEERRSFLDGWHFALSRTFGGPVEAFVGLGPKATVPIPPLAGIYGDESYTDFAVGLMPELVGRGYGKALITAAMRVASDCFPGDGFRATVSADNVPANRIYEELGFIAVARADAEVIFPATADGIINTKNMEIVIWTKDKT